PFDIFWQIQSHFRASDSDEARDALLSWRPEHSAQVTMARSQKIVMTGLALLYVCFLAATPRACLVATMAAITLLYTVTFSFKFLLTWLGASRKVDMDISADAVAEIS